MNAKEYIFPSSISYWEIEQFFKNVDLTVIGSGIVGLTTAIFYKKKHPNHKVVILERGFLPSGASTKNAGFACFGSLSEILSDLVHSTETEVLDTISSRINGLHNLKNLVGEKRMDYQPCGGYEVFRPEDEELFDKCVSFLPEMNNLLESRLKLTDTYANVQSKIRSFGLKGISNLILNQHEGSIDTGKMMRALLSIAHSLEIQILNGMELTNWSSEADSAKLMVNSKIELTTSKLHFATNGFAAKLLSGLDVSPARAQVLITKPIPNLSIVGTFHLDEGFYYFRNVGKRVLFGGGRNLDFEGETTSNLETSGLIQDKLDHLLGKHLLPNTEYEVEHRWAGVMGVGKQKKTIIKSLTENVSCSVRLGGMGVAIGTSVGKASAELLS